jgi:hypothetical protein
MKGEDMTVNEIIELLDKEENKYGGATGKERELKLSINGDFIGTITSAKLDGWGDGLITDVTLEVKVNRIEYHDNEIRAKAIDEFVEKAYFILGCEDSDIYCKETIKEIAEQLKAGGK